MKKGQKILYIVLVSVAVVALLVGITCAILLSSSTIAQAEITGTIDTNTYYHWHYLLQNTNLTNASITQYCGSFKVTDTLTNSVFEFDTRACYVSSTGLVQFVDSVDSSTRLYVIVFKSDECKFSYRTNANDPYTVLYITTESIQFQWKSSEIALNYNSSLWLSIIKYQLYYTPTILLSPLSNSYSYLVDPVDDILSNVLIDNVCSVSISNLGSYSWGISTSFSTDGINFSSYGTDLDGESSSIPVVVTFPNAGYWRLTLYYILGDDLSTLGYARSNTVLVTTSFNDDGSYQDGYDVGYSVGHDQGYLEGSAFGQNNNLISLVWATFKMPFELLFGTFNTESSRWENGLFTTTFLGVDLRAFVLGILSLSLIIRILRIVLGGNGGSSSD